MSKRRGQGLSESEWAELALLVDRAANAAQQAGGHKTMTSNDLTSSGLLTAEQVDRLFELMCGAGREQEI